MRNLINWTSGIITNMHLIILIGFITINCGSHAITVSGDLTCSFLDSMNISEGIVHYSNQTVVYNNLVFSLGQYAKINYTFDSEMERITVAPYTRGCVCDRKACIRLCCPFGEVKSTVKSRQCEPNKVANSIEVFSEKYHNKSLTNIQPVRQFTFIPDYPCKYMSVINSDYIIVEQGQVLLNDMYVTQYQYCIEANLNDDKTEVDLKLLVCNDAAIAHTSKYHSIRYSILPICMLMSVFFLIITLIVYGCIPTLQNLNGKCLLCYLATLAFGYTLLSGVQLNSSNYMQPLLCDSVGYLVYFTLFSAFLWLSVINFDLWLNFQSMNRFKSLPEQKQFLCYILYSGGIPCLLTLILVILDHVESVPDNLQPNVGSDNCFLNQQFLSQFLFFYLPVGIILLLNVVLFVLIALNFQEARKRATATEQSNENNFNSQKTSTKHIDNVQLYLGLFVIAGISWILEIVAFLLTPDNLIFLITDIWNCAQGVLIFILLVMRRSIIQLIKERFNGSSDAPASDDDNNFTPNYFRMTSFDTDI